MTEKVLNFPRAISSLAPAQTDVADALHHLADELANAQGVAIVADMGCGQPLRVSLVGGGYKSAGDVHFLLALGQKKLLDAAGVC